MRRVLPRIAGLSATLVVFIASTALAQIPQQTGSLLDRVADEQVFLSTEKILEILRAETGLLLEFKKTLVRKAYEQGKYLDPQDLTDDAVFRLVHDDVNIRVLATREIESRGYIRALPTHDEMERSRIRKIDGAPQLSPKDTKSQEQAYWATHEIISPEQRRRARNPAASPEEAPQPEYQTEPTVPVQPRPNIYERDRRRELQQAEFDRPDMLGGSDVLGGSDEARLARISPDELPSVLNGEGVVPAAERSRIGSSRFAMGGTSPFDAQRYSGLSGLSQTDLLSSTASDRFAPPAYAPYPPLRPRRTISRPEPSAIRHRPNPYADVPSLYDLYSQVSRRTPVLQRFGADIFVNGTSNFDELPMDLPAGPDYVLGPGDSLNINIWGSISQRLRRIVDREGRIALPEAGTIMVAGRTLGDVQSDVQKALRVQLRDVQADVSLARLRTVRVYVVGDVANPGPYDISALSTPLNALLTAGGPTSRGSFRTVQHYRGKQLVQQVDLYDLILRGVRSDIQPLQAGDTVLVPPMGPQVVVEGMVRRPAIYELNGPSNLADVLELAGGVLTSGTLRHIDVERVQPHQGVTMVSLDLPEINDKDAVLKSMIDFKVQDGDKIRISPILPYSKQTVFLDGHVFHPGKYPYREGMKVTDLIRSYADLLPEPAGNHAEIIRLEPPDFSPVVLAFNLADALDGKAQPPLLKPFDTLRIFGRYDFEDAPEIIVSGAVRAPGEMLTNGQTRLRDAVYLAGGVTPDASLVDAQIYRREPNGGMTVLSVDLGKALAGDSVHNVLLKSRDRLIIQRNLTKTDPPTVTVTGEVASPGKYLLAENMTASDLVKVAGGFKRGAYTTSADLARYVVQNGNKVLGEHENVAIGKAISGDADADVRLMDGDVLSVRQLSGWSGVGASVAVTGEVVHPATYGIRDGERLSSVLRRAGGFRPGAYAFGTVLERVQVRDFAEQNRQDLIHRIEGGENLKFKTEDAGLVQAALLQQQQVLTALKNQTPSGRLVIHISPDINRWANTPADVELRAGDTILIPKLPTFVLVTGQVYNGSALSFSPGKSAGWYLDQAGGPTNLADKGNIFVIRADGSVIGRGNRGSGLWRGSVLGAKLQPGDTVVVPEKYIGSSSWKTLLQTAQFLSSMAIAARVVTSF
jgi:protein involved in polysaccharide export with SLBB domain